ncbi:excisionase family DNA-binding protein [Fuerstiella marisgermanici]|uniref:DNA binding domain, excisionase family n=1 Tax=Fuerstiella marisgermanici TaxID=1891926 RepID=A0A1P8WKM4_9PLAN|nr:excisionase family DNA-binding protein [Fuerstiella marisgermanici]APZ94622.1 DNA binding domain, excisionase family [Fuerstiella marisgermanici]
MIDTIENLDTLSPDEFDAKQVSETSRQLSALLSKKRKRKNVQVTIDGEDCRIPAAALRMLKDIMVQLSLGNGVTLIPVHAELTTQEAADLLNVSRPYLVKLLEEQKLPFRLVGSHRRVLFRDLMKFKRQQDERRLKVLEEMAAEAQDAGLGY